MTISQKTIDAMRDLEVRDSAEPVQQCGTCKYAKRIDLNMIECRGVPPIPVVCGAGQDALGRMAMNIELMRPRMAVKEIGCALWAYNPLSPMLTLPDMAKA